MPSLSLRGRQLAVNARLVILDKDGTLIDLHHYWVSMVRFRAAKLRKIYAAGGGKGMAVEQDLVASMGVDDSGAKIRPEGPVGIKPRPFIIQVSRETLAGHGIDADPKEIERLFDQVDAEIMPVIGDYVKLLPGVREFLKEADALGLLLAVVTSDRATKAAESLRALGILAHFDFVLGGDEKHRPKPEPDMALAVLKQLDVRPENAVVIGDHPVDIQMGGDAGIPCCIGVLTGLGSRSDFNSLGCEVAETLKDLQLKEGSHAERKA